MKDKEEVRIEHCDNGDTVYHYPGSAYPLIYKKSDKQEIEEEDRENERKMA